MIQFDTIHYGKSNKPDSTGILHVFRSEKLTKVLRIAAKKIFRRYFKGRHPTFVGKKKIITVNVALTEKSFELQAAVSRRARGQ